MKIKTAFLAAATAMALSGTALSQAASMGECLSTDFVDFDGSIVDAAIATPELSTLVDAVVAAGLDDALATTENITVYAPTNDAFASLPGGLLDDALESPELLTAILTYHVTPSMQDPRRFSNAYRRDTLLGSPVFFHRMGGEAMVNQSAVNCQGVKADNGIVWVIDKVLIP